MLNKPNPMLSTLLLPPLRVICQWLWRVLHKLMAAVACKSNMPTIDFQVEAIGRLCKHWLLPQIPDMFSPRTSPLPCFLDSAILPAGRRPAWWVLPARGEWDQWPFICYSPLASKNLHSKIFTHFWFPLLLFPGKKLMEHSLHSISFSRDQGRHQGSIDPYCLINENLSP